MGECRDAEKKELPKPPSGHVGLFLLNEEVFSFYKFSRVEKARFRENNLYLTPQKRSSTLMLISLISIFHTTTAQEIVIVRTFFGFSALHPKFCKSLSLKTT